MDESVGLQLFALFRFHAVDTPLSMLGNEVRSYLVMIGGGGKSVNRNRVSARLGGLAQGQLLGGNQPGLLRDRLAAAAALAATAAAAAPGAQHPPAQVQGRRAHEHDDDD